MSQGATAEADVRTRSVGQADVCAVVVTRHPRLDTIESLEAIAPQVRELIIIDNGSTLAELAPIETAALRLGAQVVRFGVDLGTGAAFNFALESARVQGFRWLATFDQDSRASAAMLARMLRVVGAYPEREQVAVVAPVQADDQQAAPAANAAPPQPPPARWRLLPAAIASGALLNVAAASRVGGFDADLFLDYVDRDFCLRARRAGFQIIEASEVRMLPPLGKVAIPLSGRPGPNELLSAVRRYYIMRNRMVLWARYWRFDLRWTLSDMRACIRELVSMIAWERDVRRNLWMMLRGAFDALRFARGELHGHPR